MSERLTVTPDPVLMARLHAACRKSYEARSLPLSAGVADVLEAPDSSLPQEQRRQSGNYASKET